MRNCITYKLLVLFVSFVISCTGGMSREERERYDHAMRTVAELESSVSRLADDISCRHLSELYALSRRASYDFNPEGMDEQSVEKCRALRKRLDETLSIISTGLERVVRALEIPVCIDDDILLEGGKIYPVYLNKGDVLYFNVCMPKPFGMRIFNADSHSMLRSVDGRKTVNDSLVVRNTAVYYVQITPPSAQYADISIYYRIPEAARLATLKTVSISTVSCTRGDFLASSVKGIETRRIFDEARSFTLRGQLKSIFSGSSRALVPVKIPQGATDILYSLRISTSESGKSDDGKFDDNLNHSYHKIRFMGLPLYESKHGSGLLSTLLDDNRPLREEDAYCNMYVLRSSALARKFQDATTSIDKINYDIDYSTLGTHSCNGRIPARGAGTIYLGFENERMRYSNYIWVEVSAVVPVTEYFNYSYSLNEM